MPLDAASQTLLPLSNKDRLKAALVMATVACMGLAALHLQSQSPSKPSAQAAHAEQVISDACSPAGPYASSYQSKGLDTALASSMLLKNPHLTQKICADINGALSVAHQRGLKVSNAPLQALADSLGLDAHTTQTMMAKQTPSIDLPSPQMVPATQVQEVQSAPAPSMEPNL